MKYAAKLVRIVEAVTQRMYKYLAIMDNRTCKLCSRYDNSVMTRREIEATFPYLEKRDEWVWYPRVHPNCRCELWLQEEKTE